MPRNKSNKSMIWVNVEKKIALSKKRKITNLKISDTKARARSHTSGIRQKHRTNTSYWCNKNKENKEKNEWFSRYFLKQMENAFFMFLSNHEWNFGRTRYARKTHSAWAAGECFQKFFELSKTHERFSNPIETNFLKISDIHHHINWQFKYTLAHPHYWPVHSDFGLSTAGGWIESNQVSLGHGLKQ